MNVLFLKVRQSFLKMACLSVKIFNATIDNNIVVFELMVSFDACRPGFEICFKVNRCSAGVGN